MQRSTPFPPSGLAAGLHARHVRSVPGHCEPIVVDDLTYANEFLGETRRYDVRATRATPTSISLTWRDVTQRFRQGKLLAQARAQQHKADRRYRRLVDNSAICMALLAPSGQFQEVNQAMCEFLTTGRFCSERSKPSRRRIGEFGAQIGEPSE